MIFLTVGTIIPFDRLVMAVDELVGCGVIHEDVFGQIGIGAKRPKNFEWVETLDKKLYDEITNECSSIISHAGMGSILSGLNNCKPMIVMPRLHKYGDNINDHQLPTAEKFEELGYVLAVYHQDELKEKIQLLNTFVPRKREVKIDAVIERISNFICEN